MHGDGRWTLASVTATGANPGGLSGWRKMAGRRRQSAARAVEGRGFTRAAGEAERRGKVLGFISFICFLTYLTCFYFWLVFPSLFFLLFG